MLRSTLFLIGQILFTLFFTPLALVVFTLPYRTRYRVIMKWAFFNIWWLQAACGLRHLVEGIENIPERATIVLCKHQSAWEALVLPRYFSPLTWVLKRELLLIPFLGWGLASLRPIAINRASGRSALEQVLEQGSRRLSEGIWVVVFPEGTRVAPGKAGPLSARRGGAGRGDRTCGCPCRPQRRRLLASPQLSQASRYHPPRHWEADREHRTECGRNKRPCGGVDRVYRARAARGRRN